MAWWDAGQEHEYWVRRAAPRGCLDWLWHMACETFINMVLAVPAAVGAYTVFCVTPALIRLIYVLRGQTWVCVCTSGELIRFMGIEMAVDDLYGIVDGIYLLVWFAGLFSVARYLVDRWQQARAEREQTWS